MIADILNIIIGLAFFAFIPGFIIVKLFFNELNLLEQLLLSSVFSIMIAIGIGIFFGYDRAQAAATGGFTTSNMWLGELVVTGLLFSIYIIKQTLMNRPRFTKKRTSKKK